jgi:hypothetical protein
MQENVDEQPNFINFHGALEIIWLFQYRVLNLHRDFFILKLNCGETKENCIIYYFCFHDVMENN